MEQHEKQLVQMFFLGLHVGNHLAGRSFLAGWEDVRPVLEQIAAGDITLISPPEEFLAEHAVPEEYRALVSEHLRTSRLSMPACATALLADLDELVSRFSPPSSATEQGQK